MAKKRYKNLTILHSNDMHGDFLAEEVDSKLIGGVSRLSGYINKVRAAEPNVIYCIAGDMFRGSVIDSEFQGVSTIEIMNMLSPDVVTLGNHETDYGVAHLLFIEKCANFPIINANLHITTNGARLFDPCRIIEIDGMRVLFIGILTEEVISQTKSDGFIGSLVNVEEAAAEVGRICNAYNAVDVDLTVLLTHIGYEEDKKLAAMLDPAWGVDVIVGGHSHTLPKEAISVNNIVIVQAGTGTDQIGRFDITIDTQENCIKAYEWKTVPINQRNCPRDPDLEKMLKKYKDRTDEKYNRVITRFSRQLTHPERRQETELGHVFADAVKESLDLDIMMTGSGSIRNTKMGPIVLLSDLVECYPYDGAVHMLYVTGQQLKDMVRFMCRDEVWQGVHCEFYQFSKGVEITYNRETHRFDKFKFEGEPVDNERLYKVGLEDFHYTNFDDIFGFSRDLVEANKPSRVVATSSREIVEEYLSNHQHLDAHVDGRLTVK